MEEKKITEKESLELISQMIQATRDNLVKGSGNKFLIYGYTGAILSAVIYTLLYTTHNYSWSLGWFLMFLPVVIMSFRNRKNITPIVTYTDSMIKKVWQVIVSLFYSTVLVMFFFGLFFGGYNFVLMLPLSLLYVSIGIAITGLVIKESYLVYIPIWGFVFSIYMLMVYTISGHIEMIWHLLFGLSFVVMMIIPGYILNCKSKKQC